MRRSMTCAVLLLAVPAGAGDTATPGHHKDWNSVDQVDILKVFQLAGYSRVVIQPFDKSEVKLPPETENTYAPTREALAASDIHFVAEFRKKLLERRKGFSVEAAEAATTTPAAADRPLRAGCARIGTGRRFSRAGPARKAVEARRGLEGGPLLRRLRRWGFGLSTSSSSWTARRTKSWSDSRTRSVPAWDVRRQLRGRDDALIKEVAQRRGEVAGRLRERPTSTFRRFSCLMDSGAGARVAACHLARRGGFAAGRPSRRGAGAGAGKIGLRDSRPGHGRGCTSAWRGADGWRRLGGLGHGLRPRRLLSASVARRRRVSPAREPRRLRPRRP